METESIERKIMEKLAKSVLKKNYGKTGQKRSAREKSLKSVQHAKNQIGEIYLLPVQKCIHQNQNFFNH